MKFFHHAIRNGEKRLEAEFGVQLKVEESNGNGLEFHENCLHPDPSIIDVLVLRILEHRWPRKTQKAIVETWVKLL